MPDSLFKDAVRSFSNTFFKVIGAIVGFAFIIIGLSILSSSGPTRSTTTEVLPNHTWKAKPYSPSTPTLVRIPIIGTIGLNPYTTKEQLAKVLQDLQELDLRPGNLKGILLYIDSPGGTSDDADSMFRILVEFKKKMKIPVYAYVDGLCASGGMLTALAADKIIASSPSLIGHVGVIMPTAFNFAKTMDSLGIGSVTLYAGKDKDALNPFRPWKPDEGASLQKIINSYYDRFIKLVATHRPRITEDQLREEGAQVYPSQEALELGYIDQINDSYLDVLEEISSALDITNNYQVIELKPEFTLSEILSPNPTASILKGNMNHFVRFPGDMPPELMNKVLYLYHPEGK
jgi:protease IV